MTKLVGLVYGEKDSPLYCEDYGDYYEVINGGWSFAKDPESYKGGKAVSYVEAVHKDLRIVVPEFETAPNGGWQEACDIIMQVAAGQMEYLTMSQQADVDYSELFETEYVDEE